MHNAQFSKQTNVQRHFYVNAVCKSKHIGGKCLGFNGECWCYHNEDTLATAVCGYPNGYDGKYHSLALDSSQSSHKIIQAFGLEIQECSQPNCDCATNICTDQGCTASTHTCWNNENQKRWNRTVAGIARCIDMEGNILS